MRFEKVESDSSGKLSGYSETGDSIATKKTRNAAAIHESYIKAKEGTKQKPHKINVKAFSCHRNCEASWGRGIILERSQIRGRSEAALGKCKAEILQPQNLWFWVLSQNRCHQWIEDVTRNDFDIWKIRPCCLTFRALMQDIWHVAYAGKSLFKAKRGQQRFPKPSYSVIYVNKSHSTQDPEKQTPCAGEATYSKWVGRKRGLGMTEGRNAL